MDIALIKSCQEGASDGFEKLYNAYVKKVLGTAYLIAGNKGLAEDIVQETFIKCFGGISKLKAQKCLMYGCIKCL